MDGLPDNTSKSKSPTYTPENLAPMAVPVMHGRQNADSSTTPQLTDEHVVVPLMVSQHEFSMDPALFGRGGPLQLQQARNLAEGNPENVLVIPPLIYANTAGTVLQIPQVKASESSNTFKIPGGVGHIHLPEREEKE
jgi:hypothetical protein